MLLLHNCLLDNCTIFITCFIVNMTWFTKRNIYKSTRRTQWLKLLCACNFNFTNWTIRESESKQIILYFIPSPSTELIRQSFLYNGLNFFFNQGQQEHSKFSGKSRSYTKGREKKDSFVFFSLSSWILFRVYTVTNEHELWGLFRVTGICIRQKILSLLLKSWSY